jgi:hypothetical protein
MQPTNYFDKLLFANEESDSEEEERLPRDELESYLATSTVKNVQDALVWWHEHAHVYPRLSQMATDYLTIPGKYNLLIYFTIYLTIHTFF